MTDTIDRLLDAAENSIRRRGYHAVENSGQVVIFCARSGSDLKSIQNTFLKTFLKSFDPAEPPSDEYHPRTAPSDGLRAPVYP